MCITNQVFLRKFLYVCNFFLVLPPSYVNGKSYLKVFRICSGLYILFTTSLFAYFNIFKINIDEEINPILEILHKINSLGLYLSSTAMIIKITFLITEKYQKFLRNLWKINEILNKSWMDSNNLFYTFITYFLCLFASSVKNLYDTFGETDYSFTVSISLDLFKSIQSLLYITLSICLVQCFKCQYARIISKLLMNGGTYSNYASVQTITYMRAEILVDSKNWKEIIRLHEQICDLVDSFNSIFGSIFLPVVFNIAMSVLLYTTSFVMIMFNNAQGDLGESIQSVTSITLSLVLMVALAHECSCAVREGKLLVATCLSYSNRLSLKQRVYEAEKFEKYISILCHQAETRIPQFTAGGFFPIDYRMLTMVAGCLTTNMVIVLQFIKGNSKIC